MKLKSFVKLLSGVAFGVALGSGVCVARDFTITLTRGVGAEMKNFWFSIGISTIYPNQAVHVHSTDDKGGDKKNIMLTAPQTDNAGGVILVAVEDNGADFLAVPRNRLLEIQVGNRVVKGLKEAGVNTYCSAIVAAAGGGAGPEGAPASFENLNGIELGGTRFEAFRIGDAHYTQITLVNSNTAYAYDFTVFRVYKGLDRMFLNSTDFYSGAAVGSGALDYDFLAEPDGPTFRIPFAGGVADPLITIPITGTDPLGYDLIVGRARTLDTAGMFGSEVDFAIAFARGPRPSLSMIRSSDAVVVAWPPSETTFFLQASGNFSQWAGVTNAVEFVSGRFSVTLAADQRARFFRLTD